MKCQRRRADGYTACEMEAVGYKVYRFGDGKEVKLPVCVVHLSQEKKSCEGVSHIRFEDRTSQQNIG